MELLERTDFSGGWVPDAEAATAPKNGLLRMDNTTLEGGRTPVLRLGSSKLATYADLDIHSLHTAILAGTRYRLVGAGSTVYSNGSSIATGLAGSGDIAFGSCLGQVLFGRSTSNKRYDGTTVRQWGISP